MADPLSLSVYIVQRVFKSGINASLTLSFTDENGNQVLKSAGKVLVTQQTLETMDGRLLSTITHQNIAASPEYDIHRGGPKDQIAGIVKVPIQLVSGIATLKEVDIKDANGSVIAVANGNFLNMELDIRDSNGNAVAKVTRKIETGGGIFKTISSLALNAVSNPYVLSITGNSVPTQTLLEFLVVLELLLIKTRGSSPGLTPSNLGMPFPGSGSIKF